MPSLQDLLGVVQRVERFRTNFRSQALVLHKLELSLRVQRLEPEAARRQLATIRCGENQVRVLASIGLAGKADDAAVDCSAPYLQTTPSLSLNAIKSMVSDM